MVTKKNVVNKKATRSAILYYQNVLAGILESPALESLINMYNHDSVHFSKWSQTFSLFLTS